MARWRVWLSLVARSLALVGLAMLCYGSLTRLLPTVLGQRPVPQVGQQQAEPGLATERRVVVVTVSDLSEEQLALMPTLRALRYQGACGSLKTAEYAATQPSWTTLVSGAGPALNGGALVAGWPVPVPPDDLVSAARRAGRRVSLCGYGASALGDDAHLAAALQALAADPPDLLWLQLGEPGTMSPMGVGSQSDLLGTASRRDAQIGALLEAVDLARTCLVVASVTAPGDGGARALAEPAPLLLVGAGVQAGQLGAVESTTFAPTVSALLGIAPPALCDGDALLSALALSEGERAAWSLLQAGQSAALAEAWSASIGAPVLSAQVASDLTAGRECLQAGNARGAAQLARFALEAARAALAGAAESRLAAERLYRLPLVVLLVLLPPALWASRRVHLRWFLLACAATVPLVYYGLYRWLGYGCELAALADLRGWVRDAARHVLLALAPGTLLALTGCGSSFWVGKQRSVTTLCGDLLAYALQVCYLICLPAVICFAAHGPALSWYVPSALALSLHVTSLLHTLLAAGGLLVLAGLALLLALPTAAGRRKPSRARLNLVEASDAHRRYRQ